MAVRDDIKTIIAYMAMVFPNYQPSLDGEINAVDVLLDLLGDLPTETLQIAVKSCCAEPGRAFAPSAGEIRGMVVSLHVKAAGIPTAGEAWEEVMRAIRDVGCHNGTPDFSHPLIKKAVQAVGFTSIGMSEDVMVERAHFLKIYAQLVDREKDNAATLPVAAKYIDAQRQLGTRIASLTDKLSSPRLEARAKG
jgi:hypothetical protein